jgi:hypothetical protein
MPDILRRLKSVKVELIPCGCQALFCGAASGLPRGFKRLRMSHTILIADDNPFIREALCNLFEREEDFDVCGGAENGREAVDKA